MGAADLVAQRITAGQALAEQADALAAASRAMAAAFAAGGTLFAFGSGLSATDAQHVAVEFVHPVTVGKRAVPAMALAADASASQLDVLARPGDVALGLAVDADDEAVRRGLQRAKDNGVLTIALAPTTWDGVDHCIAVPADDPLVTKEVHVTAYHLLWELTHVFLERTGEVCITCSDQGVDAVVLELLADGMARVDAGHGSEVVSVALVDTNPGDHVLIHAGEAIAVVTS